jgi:hypothetical protein
MRAVELSSKGNEAGKSRAVLDTLGVAVGFADAVAVVAVVVVAVVGCVVLVSGAVVVDLGEQAARPMQQVKATKQQQNDM